MSTFDSVFVICPQCGSKIEFQSKAGKCNLNRYISSNVPAEIAIDLHGNYETCFQCMTNVKITADVPRVSMYVRVKLKDDEDWD